MKFNWSNVLSLIGLIFINGISLAQSDGCSNATPLTTSSSCSPVSGTTAGATQTIPGCVGTADDDVWYSFVATATSHQIDVVGSSSFDAVVELFSGSCSTLISLGCQDNTLSGGTETIYANGLTVGATYRLRVYHYYAGSGSGTFTICVHDAPPQPSNDFCSNAIPLAVNTSCSYTSATSLGASQTMTGCAGTADDDVWFSFVATNSVQTITVNPSSSMDPVVQLLDGVCVTFNSLYCEDNGFTNDNEVISAVGLTPGQTYYVRVYDYYSGNGGFDFDICVTGAATSAPSNDEPCNAIQIPPVTAECSYLNFTTTGATATDPSGSPTPLPSSCVGGSGAAMGGFSASSADVWFAITVPANGNIFINPEPGYGISDAVMALYSGSCGALTQIACSDDNDYPGSANDLKPYINATGLTPNSTVYLRYWGYGTNQGDFGICVSSPTNDDCANALYICDINGYSASTSAAYTPDRPGTGAGQMYGNGETNTGVFFGNTNTVHSGGPFGYPNGSSPSGYYNVTIDNNSWITFTASATTATLTVSIYDCWVGNYPSGGIQMQVFSGSNCDNFVSVSNFEESSTGFVITATGLVVGQDYYLVVDGYAGDICSYTITADSGVQFPDITATNNPICVGQSTTLTAPAGATSYLWYPGGQTTQSINVTPGTTTTYSCIVGGVCGYKQTLSKAINVNQLPTLTSSTLVDICSGDNVNLTLVSDIVSTYNWSATSNSNVSGESTSTQSTSTINDVLSTTLTTQQTVNYTVVPTAVSSGCVGKPQTVAVNVNPTPTMTSSTSQTICSGNAVNIPLSANISSGYSWVATNNSNTTGESTTSQSSSTINDVITNTSSSSQVVSYSVTPTSTSGSCAGSSQTVSVTVNPTPTMTSSTAQTICTGSSVNIPLTSNVTSSYSWSATSNSNVGGESTSTQTAATINDLLTNTTTSAQTVNYTVTPTSSSGSCVGSSQAVAVTVNPQPTMTSATSQTICTGSSVNIPLTSNITSTYSWSATSNPNVGGESTTSQSSSTINDALTNTTSSSQTVTYTVIPTSSTGSCTGNSQNVTVTVNPMDDASFNYSGGNTYCLTGTDPSATVTGLGGGIFTISGGATINSSTGTIDLGTSGVGSYVVTYSTSGNCPNSSNLTVDITTAPDATFSYANSAYCQTGTASVSHPSGSSDGVYSFTPSGLSINTSTGAIDLTNSTPGTYTVYNDIAAAGGCAAASYNTTVTINPIDDSGFNYSSPTFCLTGSDPAPQITGATGGTFSIDNGGVINTSSGIIDLANSGVGSYIVSYTTTGICPSTTTASITITSAPDATFDYGGTNTFCQVGTAVVSHPSGASDGTYSVSPSSGLVYNTTTGEIDLVNSAPNTYTLTNTINLTGCAIATDNEVVTVLPPDDAGFAYAGSSFCSSDGNQTPTINGSGTFTSSTGLVFSDGSPSNSGEIDFTNTPVGTYTITFTTNGTCVNDSSVSITISDQLDATLTVANDTLCQGDAPVTISAVDNGGTWSGVGVDNSGSFNPASAGVGSHDIIYTISGSCGDADTLTMVVNPVPQVSVIGDTVCDGGTAILVANGNGGIINWYSDANLTNLVASDINQFATSVSGITTLYVQETLNGCSSAIDSANANVFDLTASFTASPTSGNLPLDVDFINTSSVVDTLNDQFQWIFGTGDFSTDFETSYLYSEPGTFTAVLIVSNSEGMCIDTASVIIDVNGEYTIEIPNIFTPNGDNTNDVFQINATNIKEVTATIFDRWGLLLYTWEGINGGWDGRTKAGTLASEGTYYYFIEVIDLFGEKHSYNGPLMLNR